MEVKKSSRHSKITGDFAERLVLYWLSKYGFECAFVDHTSIDIIAKNPHTHELMDISVKARSRNSGKEGRYLIVPNDNFSKAKVACDAFGCVPYFAIVVDQGNRIWAFIISMQHLLELFPMRKLAAGWKMSDEWIDLYQKDSDIKIFYFDHTTVSWWK